MPSFVLDESCIYSVIWYFKLWIIIILKKNTSIKIYIINSIVVSMSNVIFFVSRSTIVSCIMAKRNENFIFPCISIPFTLFWIPEYTQVRFHISKVRMRSSIVRFNKSCIYSVWHAGNVHYGFQFEIPIYERRMDERSESEKGE